MESDGLVIHTPPANLYSQVRDDLLRRIASGEIKPGEMLPPEDKLSRQYGVSRITVRRAVAELAAQFLVVRRRGIGTVVTSRPTDRRAFRLTGFFDNRVVLQAEPIMSVAERADAEVAARLKLRRGATVRHIRAIAHRNGQPFTLTDAYTSDAPGQRATAADYRANVTPGYALGIRVGRRIQRAEQELDAIAADELAARHLGVGVGTPIMRARRVYLDADDRPIRYMIVHYHPERYRFMVDLLPSSGASVFEPWSNLSDAGKPRPRRRKGNGASKRQAKV